MSLKDEINGFNPQDDLDAYNAEQQRIEDEAAAAAAEAERVAEAERAEAERLEAERVEAERVAEAERAEAERAQAVKDFKYDRTTLLAQIDQTGKDILGTDLSETEAARQLSELFVGAQVLLERRTQAIVNGKSLELTPIDRSDFQGVISGLQAELATARTTITEQQSIIDDQARSIVIIKQVNEQNGPLRQENNEYRRRHGDLEKGWNTKQLASEVAAASEQTAVAPSDVPDDSTEQTQPVPTEAPSPGNDDAGIDILEQSHDATASGDNDEPSTTASTFDDRYTEDLKKQLDSIESAAKALGTNSRSKQVDGLGTLEQRISYAWKKLGTDDTKVNDALNKIARATTDVKTARRSDTVEGKNELLEAIQEARESLGVPAL